MNEAQNQKLIEDARVNPALYAGAVRALWALANGDLHLLGTVNETYQGAVDQIVVKMKNASQDETDAEWLLRQMETQPIETLRDIAKSYPMERSKLPIVKIVRATVIQRRGATDRIYLYTEFKSPIHPFTEQHSLDFEAASGLGAKFVKEKFGLDAEVIQA